MIDNIEKVLERGDRLTLLVEKTTNIQGNAVRFRRQSRRYRNTLWWRNFKLTSVSLTIFVYTWLFRFTPCHKPWCLLSCFAFKLKNLYRIMILSFFKFGNVPQNRYDHCQTILEFKNLN